MATTQDASARATAQPNGQCLFSSDQYHWLIEAGILTTDHKVELIGGHILPMAPMGDNHGRKIRQLTIWLVEHRAQDYIPQCQVTIRLAEGFTPDPDFTLLRYREDEYKEGVSPAVIDVLLVIEVADSSLAWDLGPKSLAYAQAGIPELWVVDIPHRQVHRFTQPSAEGYGETTIVAEHETITPLLIPNLQMPVSETL